MVALLVFAGCLTAAAQTDSAMSLEEEARDRAEEKLEDPQLVGLWGIETPREVVSEDAELRVYLDDEPGDGKAAGWAYRFIGQERTGIVVVADQVGLVAEYWEDMGDSAPEERPPGLAWEIDSEEAADILAGNESWPQMTPSHAVSWDLQGAGNETVWTIEATEVNVSGHSEDVHAHVDAETGEILAIEHDAGALPMTPAATASTTSATAAGNGGCNQASNSGRVLPTQDVSADVELPEPGRIQLAVSYSAAGPIDLELANEEETVWEDSVMAVGGGLSQESIHDLEEGDYTLTASSTTAAGNVQLDLTALWGNGGHCSQASEYYADNGFGESVPDWVTTDVTMGVAHLG